MLRSERNQVIISLNLITKYVPGQQPKTGLGTLDVSVSHATFGDTFSHSIGGLVRLPTVTNGVTSNDTELRGLYGLRWTAERSSLTVQNMIAQSVIVPPGSSWTSYDDVQVAPAPYVGRQTFAILYDGRCFFTRGGLYASTVGPNVVAELWPGAKLNVYDTFGIGTSGQTSLWHYRFQAALSAKF